MDNHCKTSWHGPKGTRRRHERPHLCRRWADDVKGVAGQNWLLKAKNRTNSPGLTGGGIQL